jgi:antitoxin component HigA of HigAB toxin-antitoxin module
MATKSSNPLRSDSDYRLALAEIKRCFEREPGPSPAAPELFETLAGIIEDYERMRWPEAVRAIQPRRRDRYSSFSVVK